MGLRAVSGPLGCIQTENIFSVILGEMNPDSLKVNQDCVQSKYTFRTKEISQTV